MQPNTVGQALSQVAFGEKTILDIVEENGVKKVEFKLVNEAKPLALTPPRSHEFTAVDGYVNYLKAVAPKAVVLCNALSGRCQAVLDESRSGGVEVVDFTPQLHPTFAAWNAIFGQRMSATDLATFIQKNRRAIKDGAALASSLRQIKASTKIELHEGQGNGSTNGVTVTTKIQGKEANKDIDIPDTIVIETPLFVDSQKSAKIELDLLLEGVSGGTGVLATITAPGLDVLRFEELKEYAAKFEGFQFGFGTVQHGAWKFID